MNFNNPFLRYQIINKQRNSSYEEEGENNCLNQKK